jgi:hypothetical protein
VNSWTGRGLLFALWAFLPAACSRSEPWVKLDSEVDFQSDEDDEVAKLPPVPYGSPKYGGHKIEGPLCGDKTAEDGVDSEIAAAWHSARMVDDPNVLEESVRHATGALKAEPRAARAELLLGSALAKLKRNRAALKSYETFVLSCPTDIDAHRLVMLFGRYEDRRAKLPKS